MISIFHKNHVEKSIITFLRLNSDPRLALPTVKLKQKQSSGKPAKFAKNA